MNRYNDFVGSLETKVLPQARRFEELKVDHEGAEIEVLEPIVTAARKLTKLDEEAATDSPPVLTVAKG